MNTKPFPDLRNTSIKLFPSAHFQCKNYIFFPFMLHHKINDGLRTKGYTGTGKARPTCTKLKNKKGGGERKEEKNL